MDFKDTLTQIKEKIERTKDLLQTEEATKNALILPFLAALGYDVFNPLEVVPEMTCDIGTKKGEKVDYAIMLDGEPIMLIECKHWQQDLNLHDNQLLRYYHVSKAKFGVLTNGIVYRFYTDLETPNKMDEKPFLDINLLAPKDALIEELKKFHKSYFNVDTILSTASELKYLSELKAAIMDELSSPSQEFVKYFGRRVYEGVFNAKVLEQFTPLVKRAFSAHISDLISDRLKAAIKDEAVTSNTTMEEVATPEEILPDNVVYADHERGIYTTKEELEAFYIVRAILCSEIEVERITYRDAKRYFAVFIDDNNRKPICHFFFDNLENLRIELLKEDGTWERLQIATLQSLYEYAPRLRETLKCYL